MKKEEILLIVAGLEYQLTGNLEIEALNAAEKLAAEYGIKDIFDEATEAGFISRYD